jgi:hypothetical protein
VLDSYRNLLTQIAENGGEHQFARDGDDARHLSDFSTTAQLLFLLEATGRIEIVGMPRLDRSQPGIHYTQIRVRLTPAGRGELEAEKQRQSS